MRTESDIKATVLIVDDEPVNIEVLFPLLEETGHKILFATDGNECLEIAGRGRPDLILLDIIMPELDGYETCRRLKRNSNTQDIPVIFLSALDDEESILNGFAVGGVDYITKPFREAEVRARITAHLTIVKQRKALADLNRRLSESERQLKEAEAVAGIGSWELDIATNRCKWSDNQYRLFGYEPGEVDCTLERFKRHVLPADLDRTLKAISECIDHKTPYDIEYRYITKSGDVRHAHATGQAERDADGNPVRIYGTFQDITEWKAAEWERLRLEQRLQAVKHLETMGVMAGGIAHDFNNLLMAVLGNVELAKDELPSDTPARRNLEASEKAAHRAVDLVRQILAYAGKGQFSAQPLDVGSILDRLEDTLPAAVSPKLSVVFEIEGGLPEVAVDIDQLEQALTSLVVNAAESYEDPAKGTVTIAAGLRICDESMLSATLPDVYAGYDPPFPEGRYVAISVSDTGRGMDEATLKRAFDPFFTTKFLGRGLGLPAVLGIIRGHKGFIGIESKPGEGTQVCLLLRAAEKTDREILPAHETETLQHVRVLVVDDDEQICYMIGMMLKRLGYQSRSARSGPEALEILSSGDETVDVVIIDAVMPGMSGVELLDKLHDQDLDIPVVLLSSSTEIDIQGWFGLDRMPVFLQKPFQMYGLREILLRVRNDL
jgi:PAS domain S-box-containing protein